MENLSDMSDMYNGQINYYYNKFYFIKDKLTGYTVEFNEYINNNYDYSEESMNLKNPNFNNMSGNNENNESNLNSETKLININTCRQLLKVNNIVNDHPYQTSNENTDSTKQPKMLDKKKIMKKLYKKLAKKCHPDKVSNKYLNFYFVESQKAMKENNLAFLIFLLNKAKINTNVKDLVVFIHEDLTNVEKQIKILTSKIEWQWGSIGNQKIKELLLNNYVSTKKLKKKSKKK